jgi:hypothetical protein
VVKVFVFLVFDFFIRFAERLPVGPHGVRKLPN